MLFFCLKCREKTETSQMVASKSMNGKNIMKGVCIKCSKRKHLFIKAEDVKLIQANI